MQQSAETCRAAMMQQFNTIALDSFLNNLATVKNAISEVIGKVASMFGSFLSEAEKIESVGARLGSMLGNNAAGAELASSLERMATNGVVSMQELEQAAGALVGTFSDAQSISRWVGVFADISAGSKISAARLAEMTARLDDMGKAELTELANAGIPVYSALAKVMGKTTQEVVKLSAEGKVSARDLLEALQSLTQEGSKYHDLNATMSNTTAGSWDTLAASWAEIQAEVGRHFNDIIRPMLQRVSAFLQKFKAEISAILGYGVKFGVVMAGVGVGKLVMGLRAAVASMATMYTLAGKIKLAFAAIGKIGWVALVAGAWELGSWAWDKFSGAADARQAQEKADRERQVKQAIAQESDRRIEAAELDSEAAQRALDDFEHRLSNAKKIEEVDKVALELRDVLGELTEAFRKETDKFARQTRSNDLKRAIDLTHKVGSYHEEARKQEAADKVKKDSIEIMAQVIKLNKEKNETDARALFESLSSKDQMTLLRAELASVYPLQGETLEELDVGIRKWMKFLADTPTPGDKIEFKELQRIYPLIDIVRKTQQRENEQEKELAKKRAEGYQTISDREAIIAAKEANDPAAVQRIEDAQAAAALAKEWEDFGIPAQEARRRAADVVARERAIEEKEKGARREFVADSLQTIGGGGRGFALGEAQLQISRRQVDIAEKSRELLAFIAQRIPSASSIPVTP